jgi:hypothetical protein
MAARVTQSVIEVATLNNAAIFVTQSVIEVAVALGVTCDNPPAGSAGVAYSHTFPAGGGFTPYVFSISAGSLPPGLGLNASTGAVTGTPTTTGVFFFTVGVVDSDGVSASVNCSISISGSIPRGKAITGAGSPKFCPEVKRNVDWAAFQRSYDALKPADVEEVRVPRCPPIFRRW